MLVATLVSITVLLPPRTAHACSCVEFVLSEYAGEVDIAFSGRQSARIEPGPGPDGVISGGDPVTLVIHVERVYKGSVDQPMEVRTSLDGAACGQDFARWGVVGIVAFNRGGQFWVGSCSSPVSLDELEEVFGEGHPVEPLSEILAREAEIMVGEAEVLALEAEAMARRVGDIAQRAGGLNREAGVLAREAEEAKLDAEVLAGEAEAAKLDAEVLALESELLISRDGMSTVALTLLAAGGMGIVAVLVILLRRQKGNPS